MKNLKYCRFCGSELTTKVLLDGTTEKYCQQCDEVFFDEPSPAVIVAVVNADKILLTRSVGWDHPYWGLVAGHVKSGETAEEAAAREVNEEVGVNINNLELLGTYAAKGRNFLMVGFKVETKSNYIRKAQELEKAEWFRIHEPLPLRPSSIATQIVTKIFPKATVVKAEEGTH